MTNPRHTCLLCGRRKRRLVNFQPPHRLYNVWFCNECIASLSAWLANVRVPRSADTKEVPHELRG